MGVEKKTAAKSKAFDLCRVV